MSAIRNTAIALGTTAVVAGGAGAFIYFNGLPGSNTALNNAKLVPKDALMTAYLSTDVRAWSALNQFGTPGARKLLDQSWTKFKDSGGADSKVSLEKDILPWVDGVLISVLPTTDIEAKEPVDMLLVVGVKSPDKALKFKAQIEKEKGVAAVKASTYKGETISEVTYKKGSTPMNVAVLNGKLVISSTRNSLEQAIDTSRDMKSSLAAQPNAPAMLEGKTSAIKNPIAQLYIPSYSDLVNMMVLSSPSTPPLPPETLKQLALIRGIGTSIGIENNGLRMQSIAKVDASLLSTTLKAAPSKITKQFPAQTVALFSGFGLAESWNQIVTQSEQSPDLQAVLNQARSISQQALSIDIDKDIFGWMEGEFALGFVPVKTGVMAQAGIAPAIVIDSSDRGLTDELFEKVSMVVNRQRALRVDDLKVGSLNLTQIRPVSGASEPFVSYGWLNDSSMLVAMGPTVTQLAQPATTLDQSPNYKAITADLPQSNIGQGYIDVDQAVAVMQRLQVPIPADALEVLQSIRGFGLASTIVDKETTTTDMQLVLRKTGEAQAVLP
jgi:Protein of unknown function (DUF3352)